MHQGAITLAPTEAALLSLLAQICCQRKTLDEMSREIEQLLQQNAMLQERLDRKPLEVQDAIEQALANVDDANDREKSDLARRVRELEGHTDKVMMRHHGLLVKHDGQLKIKDQDLAAARAQIKALKDDLAVMKKENVSVCTEINRQVHALIGTAQRCVATHLVVPAPTSNLSSIPCTPADSARRLTTPGASGGRQYPRNSRGPSLADDAKGLLSQNWIPCVVVA